VSYPWREVVVGAVVGTAVALLIGLFLEWVVSMPPQVFLLVGFVCSSIGTWVGFTLGMNRQREED
jgi:putative effector of murein hydrolase